MSVCENSAQGAAVEKAAGGAQPLVQQGQARPWGAWISLTLAMSIAGSAVVAGKLLVGSLPVFLAAKPYQADNPGRAAGDAAPVVAAA